jgi:EAL domain-containing protein (putative c-di-GMP-specific phosphodiesterase class I)
MEALVRWRHPEMGVVSPGRFIPVCEEIGLILPLGDWVLRQACGQSRDWSGSGRAPVRMAINLSSAQFKFNDLLRSVSGLIECTGIDPACLELELTESMIMQDAETTIATMQRLKNLGLRLAIDDFGTGYSSLSYLSSFPIDRIKIAQRFVRNLPGNDRDAAIVEAVIAIARSLGIETIAEGVETPAQLEFLRSRGCTDFQGFYFARPLSAGDITGHLPDWQSPIGLYPFNVG